MRIFKTGIAALAVMGVLALAAPAAEAAMILRLQSGAAIVTVVDGDGDGVVSYSGAVGANFTVNVSTGLSKPLLPNTPSAAHMDLNSVNLSNNPASIDIWLTDTDFLPTRSGTLTGRVGGTVAQGVANSASFFAWKDPSNREFGTAGTSVSLGPFGPGAFSGTASASHGALGPYSMTMLARINHADIGVNSTSFNFEVENIPEPASLLLLGLGLVGAGAYSRRRR